MTSPTLQSASPSSPRTSRDDALLWAALALTLVPQLLRATSNFSVLPGWDQDPLTYALSAPALTPAGSLLIDALTLIGAALLFLRSRTLSTPLNLPLVLLALIGAIPVILHGWFLGPGSQHGSLDAQRIGSSWLAAIASAVALWHAAQDQRVRRLVAGTLLGLISLLALFGIVQVYFLHAQTLADFNANPDRFLAAHGWTAESSMAKSFIRRLSQPEASAWFGLANVYATFAAATAAASLTLLTTALLSGRASYPNLKSEISPLTSPPASVPRILLLVLLSALSLTAVYLSHSKGGNLAFAAALGSIIALAVLAPRLSPRVSRALAVTLGLASILAPIALVLIRGLLGEHALHDERSLLFRSFYARASAHIFADHPLLGVGPDGFQRAFTLAKPPLCPEEVSSPHCIPLDYLADLGICGLAWLLLLARLAINAATNAAPSSTSNLKFEIPPSSPFSRPDLRLLAALPIAATLLATYLESPFITPETALIRTCGLILWCLLSWAIARSLTGNLSSRLALLAAALALIAHAQIDVTASFPPSASLWLMLIAVAAAPYRNTAVTPPATKSTAAHLIPALAILALSCFPLLAANRARALESHLTRAADIVHPIPEITDRLGALAHPTPGAPPDSIDAILRDLRTLTNNPSLQPTSQSLDAARAALFSTLLPKAIAELQLASNIYPDQRHVLREASRLHTHLAAQALELRQPDQARAQFDNAVRILRITPDAPSQLPDPSATEFHWLASILERQSDSLSDPDARRRAIAARLQVATLDPYNLDNAFKLFRDYQILSNTPEAARWATRAILLHDYTRLDRETRGLSPADLAQAQAAARQP